MFVGHGLRLLKKKEECGIGFAGSLEVGEVI